MQKRLALTKDGKLTYCTANEENIGKGRCNHLDHQKINESVQDFVNRISDKITNESEQMKPIKNNPSLFLAKKLWDQNVYIGMKMESRNMTFLQTQQIINGVNDGSIILDDIQAVLDNRDAWKELFNTLYEPNSIEYAAKLEEITAKHEALYPGKIRNGNISISGVDYIPPIPNPDNVKKEYNKILQIKDIKDRAVELFCYISRNQIFWEGNKRTSLLIANKELISNNCGTLCIDMKAIDKFNSILSNFYETGDKTEIKNFLKNQIKEI